MTKQHRGIGIRAAIALAAVVVTLAACGATPAATAVPPTQAPATLQPATVASEPTVAPPTEASAQANQPTAEPTIEPTAAAVPAAPAITKLNLNTATGGEFLTVPNVGNRMVREFMEYRPYLSIQQFRREIGKYVDEAQVAEYEKYVFVPIAPNDADAATLQQIPGVDQAIADQLIAARPFADKAAFVAKLSELISAEQAATGAAYVE
jgi:DNA uptake protein ComE-like DNA-binding protein